MDPQRLALDAANQAIEDLGDKPNTSLMYAAFGLLDAFIKMAEEKHVSLWEDLYAARDTLQDIIDAS